MAAVLQFPYRSRRAADEPDTSAPAVAHHDRRMPRGWWILPAAAIGSAMWWAFLSWVLA